MQSRYHYNTDLGPFHIVEHEGLFRVVFRGYDLGAYLTAQHAADDLAQGKTFKAKGVKDTAALGIPSDLRQWQQLPS